MTDNDNDVDDTEKAIKHLAWAATPAIAAAIAVLIQIMQPYVPASHQELLWGVAIFCGNVTLAIWLWCAIVRTRTIASKSRDQMRVILAIAERTERALQGLHRRLDAQDREIAHLRRLVMDETPVGGIGPSPYS